MELFKSQEEMVDGSLDHSFIIDKLAYSFIKKFIFSSFCVHFILNNERKTT